MEFEVWVRPIGATENFLGAGLGGAITRSPEGRTKSGGSRSYVAVTDGARRGGTEESAWPGNAGRGVAGRVLHGSAKEWSALPERAPTIARGVCLAALGPGTANQQGVTMMLKEALPVEGWY